MSSSAPSKLGKYEIIKEVGRGSMGVVFAAYDPDIERSVAVKLALADALQDRDSRERFRKMFFNEAHTARLLRHPNILEIFDAGVDDDKCYIVMELVEGGTTLKEYCTAEKLLSVNQAAEIVFKCAQAVDYAHKQGVIHRDIKPTNILLTKEMDVKIADFSIAHSSRSHVTHTMPMELFTGHHPFGGESFSSLIHKVINEDPFPMKMFRSSLPGALERTVFKALEKSTKRRYRSGLDFASQLSTLFSNLDLPQADISVQEKPDYLRELNFFRGFPDSEI